MSQRLSRVIAVQSPTLLFGLGRPVIDVTESYEFLCEYLSVMPLISKSR